MMNRQLKPLLLAASAVLLATACNDDNNGVDISRPIDLHLAPAAPLTAETRAAIDAPSFDSDDVVGLYLAWTTGATEESPISASIVENTTWKDGKFTGEPLYWQNTVDQHTIYAYYPHTADEYVTNYTVPVSIKQDQNTETAATDYEASDVLWAKRTAVAQNNLPLPLGHCMSLVTVTLEKGEGYAETEEMPTITKVELLKASGFQLEGTMKLADGDVTATAGGKTATPLTTYYTGSDYRAILLPDELISNVEDFICITLADGTTYTYKPETAITTTANTVYNFALKLNKAGVDLSGLTISKWGTTASYEGGAGMDIPATQTPSN